MNEPIPPKRIRFLVSTSPQFMSIPTSAFRDLNLGQMPETRSKTKLGQLQRGRKPTNHSRGRGRSHQASTRTVIPPPENAGSLESKPLSSLGFTEDSMLSELCVDRLQQHESPSGAYYAFQLKRPISVRIFSPESGERKIECTCEDHQKNHSFCIHISVSFLRRPRKFELIIDLLFVVASRWTQSRSD